MKTLDKSRRHASNPPVPEHEIRFSAIRAQGAGGQNVNKVSSAIHLSFDIRASSLPDAVKTRLLNLRDKRIDKDGVIHIKAQEWRTQPKNREAALKRLYAMIEQASAVRKTRKPTRPTRASANRRIQHKIKHGRNKALRRRPIDE